MGLGFLLGVIPAVEPRFPKRSSVQLGIVFVWIVATRDASFISFDAIFIGLFEIVVHRFAHFDLALICSQVSSISTTSLISQSFFVTPAAIAGVGRSVL